MADIQNLDRIPKRTLDYLKRAESKNGVADLTAFKDAGGVWTIGHGATRLGNGARVKDGDKITSLEAEQLLRQNARQANSYVDQFITKPMTRGQRRALLSLVFNIGPGSDTPPGQKGFVDGFRWSTTVRKFNASDSQGAGNAFKLWRKVTDPASGAHIDNQGLINRRNKDLKEFLSED